MQAGAWAVGLNFHPASPRLIEDAVAEQIGFDLKRRAEAAGVFVNAPLGRIASLAERCSLTIVQLHGDEGPSFCAEVARRTGCKVIKAFRVRSTAEIRGATAYRTDFHLFDGYRPGTPGGTGESFDWELVAGRSAGIPAIVAGGLTAENVGEAIEASNPYAVDVAGGVEDGTPGIKDHDLIRRFVDAAHLAGGETVEEEARQTPAEAGERTGA